MRIGYDVTSLGRSMTGVGYYTQHLLNHLLQMDSEDEFVLLSHRALQDGLERHDHVRSPDRFRFPNRSIWMQMFLPLLLRDEQPDVCHFTNFVAPLMSSSPTVVTIHDMTQFMFPHFHSRRSRLVIRSFVPAVVRKARAIITVSESACRDIVRLLKVPETKMRVIYEAAAPIFRPLSPEELAPIVEQYHLDPAWRYILYVGTIEPRKNLLRLVDAFHMLRCEGLPVQLLIVGRCGLGAEDVFRRVENYGLRHEVHFMGYVPTGDLVGIYNASHVFAFPSVYEGFGLPPAEAMACGLPVVTSRSSSLVEVVSDAALKVDPMSVEEIAAGLRCVLVNRDLALCLREQGIRQAANFSWDRAARSTLDVYREVARKPANCPTHT